MQLFGIGGTNGAGKDSVGEMLAERHNFLFVSVSDLLRDEARKRGLPIEREVLRTISAEWRREFGLGVLVDRAVEQAKKSGKDYAGVVAIPMRNVGEAQHIHDLSGTLVWVDADPRIRYNRIASRQRSAEDKKTFEQFLAEETFESNQSGDSATLDLNGVKKISDIFISNDGDDIEAFKDQVEKALELSA
jgi:cytidylate kinase